MNGTPGATFSEHTVYMVIEIEKFCSIRVYILSIAKLSIKYWVEHHFNIKTKTLCDLSRV